MSPQANTATRTVLSLLFLASASAAPWLTPAHALAIIASVTGILGGILALSNLFHVPAKVTAVMAKVVAVLDDVAADIPADTLASAKKIAKQALVLLMLGTLVAQTTACISSAPVVPVTPANQAQIASCQSTASAHNGLVFGDFAVGGLAGLAGIAAAADTDTGRKTAWGIGAAGGAAVGGVLTALVAYTAANFANGKCSDVVGPLPPSPFGKTLGPVQR